MTHAQAEPASQCDGWLKPDRYRLSRNEPTRKWRCVICHKRFWWTELFPEGFWWREVHNVDTRE